MSRDLDLARVDGLPSNSPRETAPITKGSLLGTIRRDREEFDAVIAMHTDGRRSLMHRDGVNRRIMARKRARITAITGGGAIADVADYQVRQEPEGTFVGTLNEDFAVEANVGDIFQLGNTSWRILKVERGVVRVADARGQAPTIPFWLGEGPAGVFRSKMTSRMAAPAKPCRAAVARGPARYLIDAYANHQRSAIFSPSHSQLGAIWPWASFVDCAST